MRITIRLLAVIAFCAALSTAPASGVTTKQWTEKTEGAGIKIYDGVMYSEHGEMMSYVKTKKNVYRENFSLWAGALDNDGTPVFGGGDPAAAIALESGAFTEYGFEKIGRTRSISVMKKIKSANSVMAGVSGSGLVLELRQGQKKFALRAKLPAESIWDIEDAGDGNVYVATGPLGQIFRIDASGKFEPWARIKDSNALFLLRSSTGRLFAGGGDSGNLYEIKGRDKIDVFYHFDEEVVYRMLEIKGGFIVAVNKMKQSVDKKEAERYKEYFKKFSDLDAQFGATTETAYQPKQKAAFLESLISGSVYHISGDYVIEKIASFPDEYALDVKADANGRVFIASGPRGRVYMLKRGKDGARELWTAFNFEHPNITSIIIKDGAPAYFTAFGGEAVVYERLKNDESNNGTGTFYSGVFNAGGPVEWGRLYLRGSNLRVHSRHGNTPQPDDMWTRWIERRTGEPSELPRRIYKFSQLKFSFSGRAAFGGFDYYYVEKNQRPKISGLKVSEKELTKDGPERKVTWEMSDHNGDKLLASVWIRQEGTEQWIDLTNGHPIDTNQYALKTWAIPEGRYTLKVVVSDASSNYPDGLSASALSYSFAIDIRMPEIENLKYDPDKRAISGRAMDKTSVIKSISFSIDGGPWRNAAPSDGILDGKAEDFVFVMPDEGGVVTVRAEDAENNEVRAVIVPAAAGPQ